MPCSSVQVLSCTHKTWNHWHGAASSRPQSTTALQFYQNRQLELYAAKKAQRLTLRQLVFFGRSMNEERLIKSANYVRTELPIRIAHRLRDLQGLPYIVVTQEGVAKVYGLYWTAFDKLRRYPQINTLADNEAFCKFVTDLLDEHATVIPNLSLGLSLSSPNLPSDTLDSFMRRMLISRISRRVLAEHHIALSQSFNASVQASTDDSEHVGIISTGLRPKDSIEKCARMLREQTFGLQDDIASDRRTGAERAVWPEVVIDGHLETKFAYIREHFEYIIFELLKNGMRATGLQHGVTSPPPIRATIVANEDEVAIRISDRGGGLLLSQIKIPSDLFSFSHLRNATRMEITRLGILRTVSSSSRGIRATVSEQIDRWKRTDGSAKPEDDPEREAGVGPHAQVGLGLPMSNIFATYFGGSLELVTLGGWGTDAYVRLPKLGTNLEGIEV